VGTKQNEIFAQKDEDRQNRIDSQLYDAFHWIDQKAMEA